MTDHSGISMETGDRQGGRHAGYIRKVPRMVNVRNGVLVTGEGQLARPTNSSQKVRAAERGRMTTRGSKGDIEEQLPDTRIDDDMTDGKIVGAITPDSLVPKPAHMVPRAIL